MSHVSEDEQHDVYDRCNCGRITTFKCCELWAPGTLTPCRAPLCATTCPSHRHQPGTMGYVGWVGRTDYKGDKPDGPGLLNWLKSRWRFLFWSPQRKAQDVLDTQAKTFAPPAPLPRLMLEVHGTVFESRGTLMVDVTGEQK